MSASSRCCVPPASRSWLGQSRTDRPSQARRSLPPNSGSSASANHTRFPPCTAGEWATCWTSRSTSSSRPRRLPATSRLPACAAWLWWAARTWASRLVLNQLAREERAVVNDLAGTTRDPVDEIVNIDGEDWLFIHGRHQATPAQAHRRGILFLSAHAGRHRAAVNWR